MFKPAFKAGFFMMFENLYKNLNAEKVKKFLENNQGPHYESSLIKIAYPKLKISYDNPLEVFRHHFVLFNFLFELQNNYYKENKYLHVHFMRINLIPYPTCNSCRFYDEYTNCFCAMKCENDYCNFHKKILGESIPEQLSVKYFYLCKDNFYLLNEKTAEAFMNGSWKILKNYDFYYESLKILDVSKNSTLKEVRKKFYKLAKETHPDLGGNDINKFIKINNAYQFLLKIYSNT